MLFLPPGGHIPRGKHIMGISGCCKRQGRFQPESGDRRMKISDFQTKDVVNIVDGKKLGQISDLEIDLRSGRIDSIVVPNQGKFFGLFGNSTDVIIPWRNIVKIGMDVVLVKLDDARMYRTPEDGADPENASKAYR